MPWLIGIDEAGYGPNLGPLVMTAVACRVPPRRVKADLWELLRVAVRRAEDSDDGRLLVADSKVVYSPGRGLLNLETGALVLLDHLLPDSELTLAGCLDQLCPSSLRLLSAECWYVGDSHLPLVAPGPEIAASVARFRATCASQRLEWGAIQSAVVCSPAFNDCLARWGSKGAVLGDCLATLIGRMRERLAGNDTLVFLIDKHGGRNHYAATVQNAVPGAMVVAREESAGCSTYAALGLDREVRFTFQPRADAEQFCVAAASMVSKYVRELLMHEFNRFWKLHVPDLKPTAGYPGDANRFFKAIGPTMHRLGIGEAAVWRRK